MAKVRQGHTLSATHDGTQIEGVKDYNYKTDKVEKTGASDGESLTRVTTDFSISGQMTFDNEAAANEALVNLESNLVITATNPAGGTRVTTIKNVEFKEFTGNVPTRQDTKFAEWRLAFIGTPGPSDTPATMVTHAAGA